MSMRYGKKARGGHQANRPRRQNNFFGQKINLVAFGISMPAHVTLARSLGLMRTKANETTWWINVGSDQDAHALDIVKNLRKAGIAAKVRVVDGPPVRPKPTSTSAYEPDPRDVMVSAYRKMEWQREQKEFTAAAPQHEPEKTLPPPRQPELRKRQARSAEEERHLEILRKLGRI